eukprot:3161486-Rhodomonas_salina.3
MASPVSETFKQLLKKQLEDPLCSKLVQQLEANILPENDLIRSRYSVHDGVLMWSSNGRLHIIVPPQLSALLLSEAHDSNVSGHLGVDKTYNTLSEVNKLWNSTGKGPLQPIGIPELPFLDVRLDFEGQLPLTKNGNNFLLTVVDYKTRITRFIPCKSDPDNDKAINAEETASLYFKYIFRHHSLPALLWTDRGGQFVGEVFREIFKLCCTNQAFGAAYHPQSQGLTEHSNRSGVEALRHYLSGLFEDWEDHLPAAEFALNHAVSQSFGILPFEALYGFNPSTPLTIATQTAITKASTFMQCLRSQIQGTTDALLKAQLKQAELRSSWTLKPGDYALVSTGHLNLAYLTKLMPKYLGPFKVLKVLPSWNTAKLELPATMKSLDSTFSFDCLCRYLQRDADLPASAPPPPPPAFVDAHGNPAYFVERIVAERPCTFKGQKTVKYLVLYVG